MKAMYEAPVAEKLEFDYSSVVAASTGNHGPHPHGDVGHGVSHTDKGCNKVNDHEYAQTEPGANCQ